MKPTLLIVNSKDRLSGTSSDFNYQIKYYGKEEVQSYRIGKITIPYSFYNIKQQFFRFYYNGSPSNVDIPAGNYSAQSLATYLTNEISNSIPATVTVTYSSITNKFTVVVPTPNTFYFDFIDFTAFQYSLYRALGFPKITTVASSYTSPNCANLNASDNLYIFSQALSFYTPSIFQTQRANIIQLVPILVNPFNFIFYENQQQIDFPTNFQTISTFDVKLVDDYGQTVDLNGLDWTFEIQLFNPMGDK